jgi:hypothetical protein
MTTPLCHEVYDIFKANNSKLDDVTYLNDFLTPHCVFRKIGLRGSRLRIIQLPLELARFLVWMRDKQINRYLEIGTSTGGSWFLIDSYLRAANPDYRGSIGYDRTSKLRDADPYFSRFKDAEFRHQSSIDLNLKDEQYDLTYIDACHQEQWVWHDFLKVKTHSRFVAFHDIVLADGSTVSKFWQVAKNQYPSWEFIDTSLPETCGIGVLQVR